MQRYLFVAILVIAQVTVNCLAQYDIGQPSTFASTMPTQTSSVYLVKEGDNLWTLSEQKLGNAAFWRELIKQNGFLQNTGRVKEQNGKVVAYIYPGEQIVGLEKAIAAANATPTTPATPAVLPATQTLEQVQNSFLERNWPLLLAILTALIALVLLYRWITQELRQRLGNAATAGPAMVEGGVNDSNINSYFAARLMPTAKIVGPIVRGFGNGAMGTKYQNGNVETRILNNDVVYRAWVQEGIADPTEQFMLRDCGNDLVYSGLRYLPGLGFTFTPETEIDAPVQNSEQATATTGSTSDQEGYQTHRTVIAFSDCGPVTVWQAGKPVEVQCAEETSFQRTSDGVKISNGTSEIFITNGVVILPNAKPAEPLENTEITTKTATAQ